MIPLMSQMSGLGERTVQREIKVIIEKMLSPVRVAEK